MGRVETRSGATDDDAAAVVSRGRGRRRVARSSLGRRIHGLTVSAGSARPGLNDLRSRTTWGEIGPGEVSVSSDPFAKPPSGSL